MCGAIGPSPCTSNCCPNTLSQGQASRMIWYVSRAGSQPPAKACWKGFQSCCTSRSAEPSLAAMCSTKTSAPPGFSTRNTSRTTACGSSTEHKTLLHTTNVTLSLGTTAVSRTTDNVPGESRKTVPAAAASTSPSIASSIGICSEATLTESFGCRMSAECGRDNWRPSWSSCTSALLFCITTNPRLRACCSAEGQVKVFGSTATISIGPGKSAPKINLRSPPVPAPRSSTSVLIPSVGLGTIPATARSISTSSNDALPPLPCN
mmetsp:Transcript_97426/g.275556  ORF Transcript_97426/g.275556 Transcript_97426/m.275556 type:complete len:263 (+) Transcript_97426:189-977(+)